MVPLVHTNLDRASIWKVPETQIVPCTIGSSVRVIVKCKPNRQFSIYVKDARLTIANEVSVSVSTPHHPKQPLVSNSWVRVEVKFKADLITRPPDWDRCDNLVRWNASEL